MKEIIDILRQQLVLCTRALELNQEQKTKFVHKDTADMTTFARQLEALLLKIDALEKKKQAYLHQAGKKSIAELIEDQFASREIQLIHYLADKLQETLGELKKESGQNQELLNRQMKYINFSINVITQTAADPTYAPSGDNASADSKRKMFDQKI